MCGIWGVFNKNPTDWTVKGDKELAELMSVVSTSRGRHSSGFCFIQKPVNGVAADPRIIRSVGSPFSIFHNVEGVAALTQANTNATSIFGHNRHATKGSIKLSNAHPFVDGDWILVHNGTLYGGVELKPGVEVDSHALCVKINEVGIKQALMGIEGAYAIIAHNKATGVTYFARNGQRDLHYFEHDKYCYVMSDKLDLEYCLRKSNKYWADRKKGYSGEITLFKEHVLYQLTEEGIKDIDSVIPKTKSVTYPITRAWQAPAEVSGKRFTESNPKTPLVGIPPLKDLYFKVTGITKYAGQFKFRALTEENEEVVFYTKEERMDLLNQWGMAVASGVITDVEKGVSYQVRFRTIEWEGELPVDDAGTLVEVCTDCADPIYDVKDAVSLINGKFLCSNCKDTYMKYGYTNSYHPLGESH